MAATFYDENFEQYPAYVAKKYILLVVPPILVFVGTLGNTFSFIILMKQCKRTSTLCYLSVLAIMDLLVIYVGLLRLWLGQFMKNIEEINDSMCKFVKFIGYFSSDVSVWLLVIVTVERTLVVLFPLKAPHLCTARNARVYIMITVILFILINCHFLWSVQLKQLSFNGTIIAICEADPKHVYLVETIWPWVDACIYAFTPFSTILVLNCVIIHNIIAAKQKRNKLIFHSPTSSFFEQKLRTVDDEGKNRKITIMLLSVTFVFLITSLPMVTVLIYDSSFDHIYNNYDLSIRILIQTIAEMLMYTNHCINFFLYCATGKKFRSMFKAMVLGIKDCHQKSTHTSRRSYRQCIQTTPTQ